MASSRFVCQSSSLLLRSRALLLRRNNNNYYNKHSLFQHLSLETLTTAPQQIYNPSHFFFSCYRSFCSSTTHGDDDGNVNAPARISQGDPVKRKPPGRPHQKLNEPDNESSSTTHHGVKASPGIAHGELVERKSHGGGKLRKKSNEPDESCSTNHGVNALAGRISPGEHVKRKPPGRPHQKLNEPDIESSSTTHHGVKASTGIAHGELVERKSHGSGKPRKKSNEPDESCSTNAGRISQGEHVKKKPPGRPCKKLDQPASGMIYFLPRPSLTLSEQTQKRDRIKPPKSGPPRGGKRREVVQSPPDFPKRGRIRPSKNGKKKDEKKEVRNTFRRAGYIFNR